MVRTTPLRRNWFLGPGTPVRIADFATWKLEGGATLSEQLVAYRLFGHGSRQNLGYAAFDWMGGPEDGNDGPCTRWLSWTNQPPGDVAEWRSRSRPRLGLGAPGPMRQRADP